MKNKNVRGILALVVVTALSFGVIAGSRALAIDTGSTSREDSGEVKEEFDVSGAENIEKAAATEDGYVVTVKEKGYGGDILMDVSFEADGETISSVSVTEHSETEGLGARIAEEEFTGQFVGMKAPVYLPGMSGGEEAAPAEKKASEGAKELESAVLQDGTYEAKGETDDNGFADQVTMTVKDGKITEVNWESVGEDGSKKSVMSESGEYTMTEDGPTWAEQAKALAEALVENQNLTFLTMDEQGKTDAVSGVSISVGGFASLAEQCMKEAAGMEEKELVLQDGTYEAKGETDDNGFADQVTMTVKNGKITEVNWDAIGEDGSKKSVMSESGEYTMTEDGPTWAEQAKALAEALVENQNLTFLTMDEQGKTDAVSGVSISVGGFVSLAEKCLNEAAGVEMEETTEEPAEETNTESEEVESGEVQAVSGATISSTAAVTGINEAYEFLQTVK